MNDQPIEVHDEVRAMVGALVGRARAAQRIADGYDQARVDELVAAAGWAIIEPQRNRELAELAVADTGIGNVDDKIRKNHRKTLGLLRDLAGCKTVGVIAEDAAKGLVEIARPVGVVCARRASSRIRSRSRSSRCGQCRYRVVRAYPLRSATRPSVTPSQPSSRSTSRAVVSTA